MSRSKRETFYRYYSAADVVGRVVEIAGYVRKKTIKITDGRCYLPLWRAVFPVDEPESPHPVFHRTREAALRAAEAGMRGRISRARKSIELAECELRLIKSLIKKEKG